jgi:hypothetical protein
VEQIGGFDVTGWSDAQKAALRAALVAKTEADAELETIEAARAAAAAAPEELVRRVQVEAERARREVKEAKIFDEAETQHGKGRVALVRTVEGAIIHRALTLEETDGAEQRASQLETASQRTIAHREAFLDSLLHPTRDEVKKRTALYPALWGILYASRDRLIVGVEEDLAGKPVVYISKRAGM